MPTIKVVTRDSHVWNLQEVVQQVCSNKSETIILDLMREGPCCQASKIDGLLDDLQVNPNEVIIVTSNQIPSSRYHEKRESFVELDLARKLAAKACTAQSSLRKIFALYIGRSNWQRLGLASHLYQNHRERSDITYHFDPTSDYHKDNFGFEEYLRHNWYDRSILEFIFALPLRDQPVAYPILWNNSAFDLGDRYKDIFCEIVCETFFSGKTFFVTEKTWRPIIHMRPFIVQGPTGYLKNLRRLGFQTFSHWWDEGYDEDPADARLETLKTNIDWIAGQPHSVLRRWYREMQPVLAHNLQTLKNLTHSQILKMDFSYE